jgi:hypothetical protein
MVGLRAFVLIFLLMPLGHALMIAMNRFLGDYLSLGVVVVFLAGVVLLFATRLTPSEAWQTFLGILAGILLWTGAVEYGLIFGAQELGVGELHGTNGEYRIMKHTWGFALLVCLYLLFHEGVRCTFFVWLRTKLRLVQGSAVSGRVGNYGPRAMFESVAILWFFYVLLLLLYDESL